MRLADAASRRQFLRSAGAAACTVAAVSPTSKAEEPPPVSFQRVVDLTHTLGPDFPMTWPNPFAMERTSTLGKDKWNAYRWHIQEHSGTHIDAPLHCSDGPGADQIPAADLVGPLVVVDIRARAATNADAQLTPDDLAAWERQHGPIPPGAIVAMLSGWDSRVGNPRKFFGLDDHGGYHFPGFHVEAVQFLHEHRKVKASPPTLSASIRALAATSPFTAIGSATANGVWKTSPTWPSSPPPASPSSLAPQKSRDPPADRAGCWD